MLPYLFITNSLKENSLKENTNLSNKIKRQRLFFFQIYLNDKKQSSRMIIKS